MKKPVFTGSATALVTPFTDRGVDYDRLAAALDRQAEGGTAAVVVCGTTGEAATLSEAERASMIRIISKLFCFMRTMEFQRKRFGRR